jgi:hypothetical protein
LWPKLKKVGLKFRQRFDHSLGSVVFAVVAYSLKPQFLYFSPPKFKKKIVAYDGKEATVVCLCLGHGFVIVAYTLNHEFFFLIYFRSVANIQCVFGG